MDRARKVIVIVAALVAALSVPVFRYNLLSRISGLNCESFGCGAMGIVYIVLGGLIIPLMFGIAGMVAGAGRGTRLRTGLFALAVSLGCMICAAGVLYIRHTMTIAAGIRANEDACAEYPQLCPSTTPSSSP